MATIALKEIFSGLAVVLTLVAYLPYIKSIQQGRIKPHVFSWIIWGLTTVIVFFAQLQAKAGVGAWPIGISGVITLYIAFLAYTKMSAITVTKSDWVFLIAAMASLPLWYFTSDPLWAVVVLTTVDLLGFGPTIRKAYYFPFDEQIGFFGLFVARNCLVIFALESYSIATILFPLLVGVACLLLIVLIVTRRRILPKP